MSEWISVKDRLPERIAHYIVWVREGGYDFAFLNSKEEWITTLGNQTFEVTHWMPLPEPPKE